MDAVLHRSLSRQHGRTGDGPCGTQRLHLSPGHSLADERLHGLLRPRQTGNRQRARGGTMGALRARHPAEVRRGRRRPATQPCALPGVDGRQDHLREAQIRGRTNQQPPQSPRRACAHRPLSRHRNRDRNNYRDRSTKAGSHPPRARTARGGCLSTRLHSSAHRQQNPHPHRG